MRSKLTYADLNPPATEAECLQWQTACLIAAARRAAAHEARKASSPTVRLRALAYRAVGDKERFTQYVRSGQLSNTLKWIAVESGAEFSCRAERSLIDGTPCAVVVTLKQRATRPKK